MQNPRRDGDILHITASFQAGTDRTKWEGSGKYMARSCVEITVDNEAVLQPVPCPKEDFRRGEFGVPDEYTLPQIRSRINGPDRR